MRLIALPILVLSVICPHWTAEQRPIPAIQAIVGATLIDGTGSVPLRNSVMIISDGRLQCVGTRARCPIPRSATILPADGLWAIPGLVDMHLHLTGDGHEYDPRRLLAAGITTARDAAGFGTDTGRRPIGHGQIERVAAIWQRIQRGQVPGPRLRFCGPGFYSKGTGGYDPAPPWASWIRLPAGDTNVSRFVDYLIANGSSCVKVFGGTQIFGAVTLEHLRALSRAGRARGLPIIGHTQDNIPLLEQMPLMDEMHHTWLRPEDVLDTEQLALLPSAAGLARTWAAWAIFDPRRPKARQLARAVADARVAWVPTLSIWEPLFADDLGWVRDNLFTAKASASDSVRFATAVFAGRPLRTRGDTLAVLKTVGARFARAWTSALHEAGVQILAGSDAGPGAPLGEALHGELANLVQAGLSPMETLIASTSGAAKRLHIPDIGTIVTGNRADIVLLEADPLADISNTRKIRAVVADGRSYRPDSLLAAMRTSTK